MHGRCWSPSCRLGSMSRVLERIVVETRGNPLALLELPRGLTPTELAGGFGLPAAVPLSASIEESFARRLADLPDDTRLLLLLAAAEPVGDPLLLWRAAEKLGIRPEPRLPARSTACSNSASKSRSAIRWCAPRCTGQPRWSRGELSTCALAEATDREADPDRRAWHLARRSVSTRRGGGV